MPAIPQILPIILKKIIITIGLIFKVFPMSFGSKMFPINIWVSVKSNNVIVGSGILRNWINENKVGIIMASNDPITGMKFNKKERTPKVGAKLLFKR